MATEREKQTSMTLQTDLKLNSIKSSLVSNAPSGQIQKNNDNTISGGTPIRKGRGARWKFVKRTPKRYQDPVLWAWLEIVTAFLSENDEIVLSTKHFSRQQMTNIKLVENNFFILNACSEGRTEHTFS